jgi:molybdopterin converting factor subunit 1
MTRTFRVQYFALLREQAGRTEERVTTSATTPGELYAELQARYPFRLERAQLRVAVNAEFRDWSTPLADGDSVVFIPPVAGG